MTVTSLLPPVSAILFVLFALRVITAEGARSRSSWKLPAAGSALFLLFTLQAVVVEGPLGFWTEHTRNLWGNQIWLDLLCAAGIGLYFVAPQARALGVRLLPWLVLIVGTGSIGFLAMVARLLYLRDRAARA